MERLRVLGYRIYGLVMHPISFVVIFVVLISVISGGDDRARRRKEKQQLVDAWKEEHDRPLKAATAALQDRSPATSPSSSSPSSPPSSSS